jgi:uncharacterized membrane protein
VLNLTKKENPVSITLFVADKWKYGFVSSFKEAIGVTRDVGEVIKKTMIKEHGKDISSLVPRLVKDLSKIPETLLDQDTELKSLKNNSDLIKREFGCKNIEIIAAEVSKELKAKQAMPGKPAILIG